jgi:hypothetical protein
MPGKDADGHHSQKHSGKGMHGPHRMRAAAIGLTRFLVITLIMLGIGWGTEKIVNKAELLELSHSQTRAIAAVRGLNPWQIKDRFFCAMTPSVESVNRKFLAPHPDAATYFMATRPLSADCATVLAVKELRAAADAQPVPETLEAAIKEDYHLPAPVPVVGHWADGMSAFVLPVMAFLDTAWHLIVQPSVFASIFAIFSLVMGGILAGVAMAMSRADFPGYIGPLVWCAGTIAATCLVAWGLREVMEGALFVFGKFTQFAGVCCGGGTIAYFGYAFSVKAFEVKTHSVVEHLVSR